ncbi:sulfurase [Mesobacillus campisalis]|uniref:Sulfurase n=1 Tax=Mesobacillus campisalis TaxID=1408103 RepID=A0A0M2SXQ9_9BACI|nr:MOSC domain-containing protein [Mesobacillus campisalis]KKK37772.1 sulfurase [Mesobacillus campisalis]
MEAAIVQLNVGMPKEQNWRERRDISAIGKIPIEEAMLWKHGFDGDGIADTKHHGGPDRAVCLYPFDHYSRWEKEYGTKLKLPAFGENITVAGITENDLYIGDVFQLGDAVVEITQGRVPCSTISRHNGIDTLLNRVFETCLTGCFFRVREEGIVRKTSGLKLISRVQKEFSVYRANQLMLHGHGHEPAAIAELVQVESLADEWKRQISKRVTRWTKT